MKKCCESAEWQQKNRPELLKTLSEFLEHAEFHDLCFLNEYIDSDKPRDGLNLTAETIAMLGAAKSSEFKYTGTRPRSRKTGDTAETIKQQAETINAKNEQPSAARQWCKDRLPLNRQTPENIFWFVTAHEAGQKHGAAEERKKLGLMPKPRWENERKGKEPTKSAAETWAAKITPSKVSYGTFGVDPPTEKGVKLYSFTQLMAGHEAGQKHGASVERERVSPLICDIMSVITMLSDKIYSRERIQDILDKALKTYQRGHTITGPDLELPEKPSWAEPTRSKVPCFQCGHPLTPIKD